MSTSNPPVKNWMFVVGIGGIIVVLLIIASRLQSARYEENQRHAQAEREAHDSQIKESYDQLQAAVQRKLDMLDIERSKAEKAAEEAKHAQPSEKELAAQQEVIDATKASADFELDVGRRGAMPIDAITRVQNAARIDEANSQLAFEKHQRGTKTRLDALNKAKSAVDESLKTRGMLLQVLKNWQEGHDLTESGQQFFNEYHLPLPPR